MQIVVDQLLTSYQLSGSGKLVVLLHGWGDDSTSTARLRAALDANYQTLAIDLPGFGGTQAPVVAWDLSDYADFVAAVLKKLALKPYALLGHSNGGAIAIRALASKKVTAKKLILLASAGVRNEATGRNRSLLAITKTGKALSAPLPNSVKQKLRRKLYKTVGSDMLVAEHMQETFKKIVQDDVRTEATQITIPCLMVYGEEDKATPVHYAELLQDALGHSDLHVIPNAGHFVHLDHHQTVVNLIEDFLK